MKIGDKLKAKWTEDICDHVTKGKIYEVVEARDTGFHIMNDKGNKCFPIATTFERVE